MLAIRVCGAAGLGINSTAEIILHLASSLGYDIITDIEYESRIKGGTNYYDIFIGNNQKYLSKYIDIILAFDEKALEKNLNSLKENSVIIINQKFIEKLSEKSQEEIKQKNTAILSLEINDKYDNTYLLGILSKLLDIPLKNISEQLKHIFSSKSQEIVEKNIHIVTEIYENYKLNITWDNSLSQIGEAKKVLFGNQSIANGAAEGGLEFYSAYPMTPASTILTEIIKEGKVPYLQAEDEIAVINSTLGASYTGARAMCGSSGGGFALMSEALSFAVQAEFPITVALSQRAGPSTGTPTYHEQADLNYALNPTFGDFEHIVLAPSTIDEGYSMAGLALNLADKYQTIVIFLIDKQFSEAFVTLNGPAQTPEIQRGIMLDTPPEDYKRYQLTESGVSPRVNVGTKNGDFIATSYEHDEYGATTEDSELKMKMTEKRFKKLEDFYKKEGISGYEVINSSAEKMIITTSMTRYTADQFVKNNPEFGLIIIKILKPLDERLLKEIKDKQEVIFVESNYSGQLENYITKEFGLKHIPGLTISRLRKYDLFPFYYEDFETLKNK